MNYSSNLQFQSKYDPDIRFTLRKPSHGRRIEFDLASAEYRTRIREVQRKHRQASEDLDAAREAFRKRMDARLAELRQQDSEDARDEIARIEAGKELERLRWILARADTEEARQEILDKLAAIDMKSAIAFEADPEILDEFAALNHESLELLAAHYNPARTRWGLKSIEGLEIDGEPATVETLIADGPEDLLREILEKIEEVAGLSGESLKLSSLATGSSAAATGSETNTTAAPAGTPSSTVDATA